MGILNSKTRVLDVLLTQEGRRQISQGELRIEYVSFTDDATFYKADIVSGTADATTRIYFEATNLPQDQITFEANDAGRLNAFKNINDISVKDGKILSSSYNLSGTNVEILSGNEFSSTATTLLQSSIDNFKNLRILGTTNRLLDNEKFELSENEVTFSITENFPINSDAIDRQHLSKLESLISDVKLSSQDNFLFLPPQNKNKQSLGKYKNFGQKNPLNINDIMYELSYYEKHGCAKHLRFDPTSNNNNIISQFFEISNNQIVKLDVIDFGRHIWTDKITQLIKNLHIFFVGKVLIDDNGEDTFIHLFTLVFS